MGDSAASIGDRRSWAIVVNDDLLADSLCHQETFFERDFANVPSRFITRNSEPVEGVDAVSAPRQGVQNREVIDVNDISCDGDRNAANLRAIIDAINPGANFHAVTVKNGHRLDIDQSVVFKGTAGAIRAILISDIKKPFFRGGTAAGFPHRDGKVGYFLWIALNLRQHKAGTGCVDVTVIIDIINILERCRRPCPQWGKPGYQREHSKVSRVKVLVVDTCRCQVSRCSLTGVNLVRWIAAAADLTAVSVHVQILPGHDNAIIFGSERHAQEITRRQVQKLKFEGPLGRNMQKITKIDNVIGIGIIGVVQRLESHPPDICSIMGAVFLKVVSKDKQAGIQGRWIREINPRRLGASDQDISIAEGIKIDRVGAAHHMNVGAIILGNLTIKDGAVGLAEEQIGKHLTAGGVYFDKIART